MNKNIKGLGEEMSCSSCGQSILGKNITGRSTAGYDYRQGLARGYGRGDIVYNGHAAPATVTYATNNNYPYDTMSWTTGGGASAPSALSFDFGTLVVGGILGLIAGYFLFAKSGRKMAYETSTRIAKKIKG